MAETQLRAGLFWLLRRQHGAGGNRPGPHLHWADPEAIGSLRIGDFACGTGALLSAVYEQVAARHQRAGGDLAALHPVMMEEVLYGCDVMPSAVHITSATLSGVQPDVTFRQSRIYISEMMRADQRCQEKLSRPSLPGILQMRISPWLWFSFWFPWIVQGKSYRLHLYFLPYYVLDPTRMYRLAPGSQAAKSLSRKPYRLPHAGDITDFCVSQV